MKFSYNYFTLLDDLHETMVMLMSLPVCVIIFNKKAEIIEMNNAASKILRIEETKEYSGKKKNLDINDQFYIITNDLQQGSKTITTKFEFKRPDYSSVLVNLNASLFYGLKDLYIFQFSEIESETSDKE